MTTSPPKPASSTSAHDPIEQLEAQIRRGALTGPVRPRANGRGSTGGEPLEWLEARLAEASDPKMWAEILLDSIRHAEGPLAELDDWIRQAQDLETASEGYPETVAASDAGPVERLRGVIQSEIDEIGGRRSVVTRDQGSQSAEPSKAQPPASNAEAAVGREVLKILENRDLSGTARTEAARLLATALQEPDEETLREVLEILLFE